MESREDFISTGIPGLDYLIKGFPRGGLVVVSGAPGTGKTALASNFIYQGAVKYGEPGIYVSLIEDETRFYTYMKSFGLDFEKLTEKKLFRYVPLPTLLESGMSAAITTVIDDILSINAKRIAIDSYTAISGSFKDQAEGRAFLHSVLSKITSQLKCTTMLIKEEKEIEKKEFDYVDFIADGVIHLKYGTIEDKLYRELAFIKLRGSELRNPRAWFTLHGGFKVMIPTKIPDKRRFAGIQYPENPQTGYTTGIPDLDREIGGYPDKTVILFEVDPKLTFKDYMFLTVPLISAHILRDGYCLVIPSGGVTRDVLLDAYMMYGVSEEQFRRNYHLLTEPDCREERSEKTMEIEPPEMVVKRFTELENKLLERYRRPPIRLFGVDRLVQYYGERVFNILYIVEDELRRKGGLIIWIVKPVKPWLMKGLAPIADIHFKIFRKHACMFMYGVKPITPIYGIQIREDSPIPNLIPIV
ncbi:MAG: ATPase domain-containing protein [Nitrososphaerota archaeon]